MMEISEQMPVTFVSANTFEASADQTGIFAAGRNLRVNVGAAATYGTNSSFTVPGDKTTTLVAGKSLKANCGADGMKTATVASSSYDGVADATTVNTNESVLTSNLTDVTWMETVSVASSSYDGVDTTTVTLNESVLTSHLSKALYGIRLGSASSAAIQALAGISMIGEGKRTGTGGYFRYYSNALETGAGTDKERMDGSFGTSGDMKCVTSTIQAGATSTLSTLKLSLPA